MGQNPCRHGSSRDGGLRLMKTKLLAGVALLLVGSGSALAEDLAVKPAAPAPFYKAPPMVPAVPPSGQDQANPAPMTEGDWKVAALGCTHVMLVFVQAVAAACGWARQPADDAIDEAIAAFDDFILANTSSHLTRPMLEDVKRGAAASLRGISTSQQYCEDPNYETIRQIRSLSPDQIREQVKVLLSMPAKPGRYGCL
jgi:hypothetical protein